MPKATLGSSQKRKENATATNTPIPIACLIWAAHEQKVDFTLWWGEEEHVRLRDLPGVDGQNQLLGGIVFTGARL
jgi:hypothetical protein